MTHAGLSDDVITTHIRTHGVAQSLQIPDLIHLRNNQVSDFVITTLQHPPAPPAPAVPVVAAPAPVFVEVQPAPPPVYFHMHHHRRHRNPHVSWGFSFHD
jgi:hypothetical protein